MGKELFEVFLGTFNAEPWIEQVISSLEAQDHPAFKVRIFDNASTDNTVAMISNILSKTTLKNEYTFFRNVEFQENIFRFFHVFLRGD